MKPALRATARACANIALAKYWGKADVERNVPAVPSISLTLDGLVTETCVYFSESLDQDELILGGAPAPDPALRRASQMLERVRRIARLRAFARVESRNGFPTASGLASSASGFAALAAASCAAAGLTLELRKLSALARWSSASAARSIYGGFVELPRGRAGDDRVAAKPLFDRDYWDVRIVVAVATESPKAVGSTDGMEHSRKTSPFYDSWVASAPKIAARVRAGLRERDLELLGPAMEQSTLAFHACAMASAPATLYFAPVTLAVFERVRALRAGGTSVYATMDAGPHVKALCLAKDAPDVALALGAVPGVLRTIVAAPGPGVTVDLERSG